jgi:shikimate dehydrogenase
MARTHAEVIGDPIAQSKSPLIHGFWLERLGIDGAYAKTRVAADGLGAFFAARRADPDWRGCNVTVPHKQAVIAHLDALSDDAHAIGAVNTIVREGARLVGYNSDAPGFAEALAGRPAPAHAVVIGAGGAARAVLAALKGLGAERVTLLNRSQDKAAALLGEFGIEGAAAPLDTPLPAADLLVNTSSLGMAGQPPLMLDLAPLPRHALVYDIVYAPLETALLAAARARGLATVDGLAMLIGQAAVAFAHFFGAPPPRARDAELRRLLLA